MKKKKHPSPGCFFFLVPEEILFSACIETSPFSDRQETISGSGNYPVETDFP